MASRMDRYRQKEERSTKNESLYRRIQDSSSYSNIEGIAEYDKTNEIDITRVKAMLQNRENYQKQKQVGAVMSLKKKMIQCCIFIRLSAKKLRKNNLLNGVLIDIL